MNPQLWPDDEREVNFIAVHDGAELARSDDTWGRSPLGELANPAGEQLITRCKAGRDLLDTLVERLVGHRIDGPNFTLPLEGLPADDRHLIAQVLGQGEVRWALDGERRVEAQESVMAGVWQLNEPGVVGCPPRQWIEVGAIPDALRGRAEELPAMPVIPEPPEGTMNVMPVLAELRDASRCHSPGDESRVINLTLLPMTPQDLNFLHQVLGDGGIAIESHGYGACRVHATAWANLWSVQYFNAMDALILDTLEVGDIPAAACAAQEDIEDSATRLREILAAYLD